MPSKKKPEILEPVVVTQREFTRANDLLTQIVVNLGQQSKLKEQEYGLRSDLLEVVKPMATPDNRTPLPGVAVPVTKVFDYDTDKALAWALDDKNISGAHTMLEVDEAGVMRLVALALTTDPELAEKIKDCFTLKHTGYNAALRKGTHVGMPPFTMNEHVGISLTLQSVKLGETLRDALVIVDEVDRPTFETAPPAEALAS
jgi:hypothetical protein